ncbi:hypothetical protein [Rahnella aceris]|uniref:hypothetical protein n=1 Tax=Rahnella sp. (strain Y9602) TaxID=2703885 RepID=UPI001F538BD0|nr:hypothetical protein [Rahnella aceris]UNK55612.1 hypothetical protein MNO10_23900 [Rahnella aceris]
MSNLNWSDIDIEDELQLMETLLAASLYMDVGNDTEYDMAFRLVDKVLLRIRDLKKASEVRHA